MKQSKLTILRNSTEHLLTMAMENLYGQDKIIKAMGPATDDGFYFDFDSPKEFSLTQDNFKKIEKEMHRLSKLDLPITIKLVSPEEAKKIFKDNSYKLEWLEIIQKKQPNEKVRIVSIGKEGSDHYFPDICKDEHLKSTGSIKFFKLLSIAGAYWHGDEKNQMLTRVYGTAFESKQELDQHLVNLELAQKNNHRRLGQELELFTILPELGSGLPIWLPNGYAMRRSLEDYMIRLEREYDYKHILTPHIHKKQLFETSGHLEFYKDSMYSPMTIDEDEYYLKPMNCPAGMLVYKTKPKSYKDLPLKMGELGTVYRYEKSGELQGLQRVRGFTQNDAHIFAAKDQLQEAIQEVIDMMKIFYQAVGFDKYQFVLALSDPKKKKYQFCGSQPDWKWAEDTLRQALIKNNFSYTEKIGDAAFYGPKIDVLAENVFGKTDTISTVQVDFNLPEKFNLEYTNSKGEKERPFVVHRALVGSFERFFAFLIEHFAGAFPVWLAPVQVVIIPISEKQDQYAKELFLTLKKSGIRVELDNRSDTLGSRIRDTETKKVPYILVIGERESKNNQVSVRFRSKGNLGTIDVNDFIKKITLEIEEKVIS